MQLYILPPHFLRQIFSPPTFFSPLAFSPSPDNLIIYFVGYMRACVLACLLGGYDGVLGSAKVPFPGRGQVTLDRVFSKCFRILIVFFSPLVFFFSPPKFSPPNCSPPDIFSTDIFSTEYYSRPNFVLSTEFFSDDIIFSIDNSPVRRYFSKNFICLLCTWTCVRVCVRALFVFIQDGVFGSAIPSPRCGQVGCVLAAADGGGGGGWCGGGTVLPLDAGECDQRSGLRRRRQVELLAITVVLRFMVTV